MRFIILASTALALVQEVIAHNAFSKLIVNKTVTPDWKYIRNTDYDAYWWQTPIDRVFPYPTMNQQEMETTNMTCGRNAFKYAPYTYSAAVEAGTEIGFETWVCCGLAPGIWHPGPIQIYMTKSPSGKPLGELTGYDSEWFKVAYWGPIDENHWYPQDKSQFIFTLPATTPPGDYLVRIEHWMPLRPSYAQWYVNCAHITVVAPSTGGEIKPGNPEIHGTVKFPGGYQFTHPGISLPKEVQQTKNDDYTESIIFQNLTRFEPPGPKVWKGE